jgi:ABC-type dipeptide/oligopeptide/nickel transport system ATPase subunit
MDIQQESGVAYLFITHDLAVVRWISHRIEVMRSGRTFWPPTSRPAEAPLLAARRGMVVMHGSERSGR